MIWISAEDVILIHSRVIEGSGGLDGLRDRDGLEAAVSAPMQTFDGKELYPTDLEKIARLGFGLASKDEFAKNLRSELMYYFWSKCEWEVVISPWISSRKNEDMKADVCWQVMNNWDVFLDYVWNNKRKL